MSNTQTTRKTDTVLRVQNIQWSLWDDDGPADTIEKAHRIAAALGWVIVPQMHSGEGDWNCETEIGIAASLRTAGWWGLENDGGSAEAEWGDPTIGPWF